ncbi:ribonucleases P/MRP protein subunit RPP40 [Purpureocillium lavendulum]|uniref:Ribonucleases P/MRP protein subunit RPP40 n=1 Tax=Purpureocillium lavendulum TaxID=1247861 RepID=A0AB34G4L3_9HYPO|nr:ribonucleases P/MRP protein subunit RPP40 [Purpureocillium lavendulum]
MFPQTAYRSSTCFVTYGTLGYVDPKQPPHRSKPWTDIASQEFIYKVDLVVPQLCYDALHERLTESSRQPHHWQVTASLGQLLQGNFFTEYVKTGHALMLSDGRANADRFTLHKGFLKLYLDRESFERAGLEGKPYGTKGNRGDKPRWIVSFDLTSPAMTPGKRGFDRLRRASTLVEVLDVAMDITPSILSDGDRPGLEEAAADFMPPRHIETNRDGMQVCMFSWQGLISPRWFRGLVTDVLAACPPTQWFAASATGFAEDPVGIGNDLTLICPSRAKGEYLLLATQKSS